MSYDNLSSVSQNVLKFYQQLTGEERRIPFIFDDFHFCRSRVIGLDMTENRMFTLCHMITWVVFLRMFWKFYHQLTGEERRIPFIFDDCHSCCSRDIGLDMTENRIFTLCHMITWVVFLRMFWKFYHQLTGEERRIPFIFDNCHSCCSRVIGLDMTENRILPYVVW
jgi:uncharacterized membrane protein (GlpM family)